MIQDITKQERLRIGVAPLRRDSWSHKPFNLPEAIKYKKIICEYINKYEADFILIDHLVPDGLLSKPNDAAAVAKYFIEENVDAIFAPHCNFGSEEALAKLASLVDKPLLIWGPKDYINPDDQYRYRDSQCGMFASSKVLSLYGIPFSYINNCDIDDPVFDNGFQLFLSTTYVVKSFRKMRIGQISTRPSSFASVKINEADLLEKFGIEVLPITFPEFKDRFEKTMRKERTLIKEEVAYLKKSFSSKFPDDVLMKIGALKITAKQWAKEENLSALVAMCWGPMIDTIGIAPCFAMSEVCDDGLPFICESDIHGAITAVIAQAATRFTKPMFLADLTIRHPDNVNGELLWHCGVFPKSLAKNPNSLALDDHYNRLCPAVGSWELKEGEMNVLRFDGMHGQYSLFCGAARTIEGPKTVGSYVWIEVDNWSAWERKLIYGPYIHHCVGIYANIEAVVGESIRYIPHLTLDRV